MRSKRDFFKSEGAFIEYTLIYGSGEQRTDDLGITPAHYGDKALATRWAGEIASQISDEEALKVLRRIYRRMVGDESAELPAKQEPVQDAIEDPLRCAMDNGLEELEKKLELMTIGELRAVIKEHDMDPCRQYTRTRKAETLRKVILTVTDTRMHKGDGFI